MPARLAANIFSRIPPTGSTFPRKVISPVIAKFFFTLHCLNAETNEVTIVMPALGPSFGIAPSGTWTCTFQFSNRSSGMSNNAA